MVTDPQLLELRQMTAEMLRAMQALAPLPDAVRSHAERMERGLVAFDARLDQAERSDLELKHTLETLRARLDTIDKHEARIKSLEDDRIRVKAWAALIGLFVSVGAFIAGKLWR